MTVDASGDTPAKPRKSRQSALSTEIDAAKSHAGRRPQGHHYGTAEDGMLTVSTLMLDK
jgi:hypothetical protein